MSQFRIPIKVSMPMPGGYVNGIWTEAPASWTTIQASVQPMSNTDLAAVPEGDRLSSRVKLYTSTKMPYWRSWIGKARFERQDELWLVESIEAHQMGVIPHYKLTAKRIPQ